LATAAIRFDNCCASRLQSCAPFEYPLATPDGAKMVIVRAIVGLSPVDAQRNEELRTSEQRFRAIFDHAPYAIAITSLDGRYLYFANVTAKWCGIPGADAAVARMKADPKFEEHRRRLGGGRIVFWPMWLDY
jgi:PAS domain-containing protein